MICDLDSLCMTKRPNHCENFLEMLTKKASRGIVFGSFYVKSELKIDEM